MSTADPRTPAARSGMWRLFRQSGLYTIGSALIKASGLLLALIHLDPAFLSLEDYGRLGAAGAAALILTPLMGLGLSTGLLKFLSDGALREEHEDLPLTAFVTALVVAGLALVVLWPLGGWVGRVLIVGTGAGPERMAEATFLARLTFVYAALKAVNTIPLMRIQAEERAGLYSFAVAGEFGLLIGLNYLFLVEMGMGLRGALWALVGAAGLSTLVLSAGMLVRVGGRLRPALVGRLIRFGAPLAFVGLSLPFLHAGDRFLLQWLAEPLQLSLYEAAARISGVLNMVLVQGFQVAFSVIGLKTLGAGGGAGLHRRTFRHFCIGGGGFVLGLSLFSLDVLRLIASDPLYLQADRYVFPLAFGYFFYGLYIIGVNALYARAKTRQIAVGVTLAALLNAGLNMLLIPLLGALGAALATVVSYAALAYGAGRASERLEGFRFPWQVLLSVVLVVTVLWAIGTLTHAWSLWARLGARAGLMVLYPFLVVAVGGYTMAEVRAGWKQARERVRRS